MRRQQHITKPSEWTNSRKKVDWLQTRWSYRKHCYLKKLKYELLPQVVIPTIPSHMKSRKLDNIPNTIQHTVPMTPPNTPSKATLHNIITKTPVSTTPRSKFPRISKQEVMYNFHNEIDDAELLKVNCDYVFKLLKTNTM